LPAGTRVLLQLQSPIYTKTARVGDGVYCESTFPVTQENQMAIPAGTYVKGRITHIQRPGRIKGRAELQVHFTSMVFPNGYTVDLPGTLEGTPGSYNHQVTDEEGTIKANGTKGRDVGTVASTAGAGAVIGGLATRSGEGAGIGGGIGAAVGLAQVLLTRGPDVRLERGTALEMVLQTPLTVEIPQNYENYQSRRNFMPPSDVRPRQVRRRRMGGYPMPPPPEN
jgi:type IV secretion system protein VirB10